MSFYGGDENEVHQFVTRWADQEKVFSAIMLHDAYNGAFVDSTDAEYVISKIRRDFIADSTVTMVLMGPCTHSRRYVDWELKASLRQGETYTANGLLAVRLPSQTGSLELPPRFRENWRPDGSGYARFYSSPRSSAELTSWIEDAFNARTSRSRLIVNGQDRMLYNRKCSVHGLTH